MGWGRPAAATLPFGMPFLLSAVLLGIAVSPGGSSAGEGMEARPVPLVIAHRGASGYLPEHTLPAYAAAYFLGADFIEPDVVLTADGVLLASHDITLERTTNVEAVFPGRARPDGKWYVIDFTLEEIRTLEVDGPDRFVGPVADARAEPGDAVDAGAAPPEARAVPPGLRRATLAEVIGLVQHLNRQTGRRVGVIPEMKHPSFHLLEGKPMEGPLADLLAEYGYDSPASPAIVQSFDADALRRLREQHGCPLPRVFLVDVDDPFDLDEVATFAEGLGPHRRLVEDSGGGLVAEAHARGLFVTPWTFQDDVREMAAFFREYGVDGLFTDFPDRGVLARDAAAPR